MRWSAHRGNLRDLDDQIRAARRNRDAALTSLRAECERQRKAIQASCASERAKIRRDAKQQEAAARKRKRSLWETYRIFSGSIAGQLKREYSASEHDDLTEQNIDPAYVEYFRAHRALFPRWRSPDDRAVHFQEYVEAHEDEIAAWYAARAEEQDAARAYAEEYARYEADAPLPPSGVQTITMPDDDLILSQLQITTSFDRATPLGDAHSVTVDHPAGGHMEAEVIEDRHGGWHVRWKRGANQGPEAVKTAVENWIASGALVDQLEDAVPF